MKPKSKITKTRLIAILMLLWWLLPLAPDRAQMVPGLPAQPLGYCQLTTGLASSVGLSTCSGGIPAGANMILMQSETQNVRWRDDGTAPTATVGMLLITTASVPTSYSGTISKLLFIQAAASGVLDVTFYHLP